MRIGKRTSIICIVGLAGMGLLAGHVCLNRKQTVSEIQRHIALLRDRDLNFNRERLSARNILAQIGKPAVPHLIPLLEFDSSAPFEYEMAFQAAMVLGDIGPDAKAAIPKLVPLLDDHNDRHVLAGEYLSGAAAGALGGIGKASIPVLVEALKSDDWRTRCSTMWAFRLIGTDAGKAVPTLVSLLRDPHPCVRYATVCALGWIGQPAEQAIPDIIALLNDDEVDKESYPYRFGAPNKAAIRVLAEIGDSAVPYLKKSLKSPDPLTRESAQAALDWPR